MTSQNRNPGDREAAVNVLFERMSARDFDGVVELLDPDVEFDLGYAPTFMEFPVRGRAAMHTLLTTVIGAMFNPFRLEVTTTYPGNDDATLVAEYRSEGVVTHNGRPYANTYVGIFRVGDNGITFWREYHNPELATAALT